MIVRFEIECFFPVVNVCKIVVNESACVHDSPCRCTLSRTS